MRPRFVWDPRKAQSNVSKHGITFAEAMSVFENPMAKIVPDPEHSLDEHREILVGYSASERLLVEALAKFGQPASLSTTANARSSESESNEPEFCEPRPLGSRFSEFCKSFSRKLYRACECNRQNHKRQASDQAREGKI